jgi:hypothetical protein
MRISEKMAHLVLVLALDNHIDATNKQEVRNIKPTLNVTKLIL